MYDFTSDYIQQLIDQGTTPDKVAVGNEIINGFLYGSEASIIGTTNPAACFSEQAEIYQSQPGGGLLWDYWNSNDPQEQALYDEQWDRFSTLVASGIKAVRDVSEENGEDIEVEIHVIIDNSRLAKTLEFWDQFLHAPGNQGSDGRCTGPLLLPGVARHTGALRVQHQRGGRGPSGLQDRYRRDVVSRLGWRRVPPLPNSPFPRTIQGQADAIQRVFTIANDVPDNRGVGVLMWEPLNWQDMVNWDSWPVVQPNASMDVFNKSHATHVVQDRMYESVAVGDPLALPATVRVLTTADGSVADVPVEWDDVPAGATDSPGELAVSGSTEFGDVTALVSVVKAPTTTTVASSANPSKLGAPVRFTATVSGPAVGGTVQFAVDGTNLGGPVALSNATAVSPATSALAAGAHSVTATFSGDENTLGSSGSLTQTVQYVVHVLWPTAGSSVKAGNKVVVLFLLTDAHGRPIPNGEARSLVTGSCRVTVSASGAQTLPAKCPTYIGLLRSYTLLWNTSNKRGDVTMRISVAYPGGDTQIVNVPIRLR